MEIKKGDQYLITSDGWFYAPDGRKYRAVFGTVHGIRESQSTLGVKTNAKSTNWYVVIGNMILAGCQIHYAVKTENVDFGKINDSYYSENGLKEFERESEIYNADG